MGIAVLGGTFDPVHLGHLIIAEQAYNSFSEIDKVLFMPAGIPPHKNIKEITEDKHRLNMLKKAIEDNTHFFYSSYELQKKGKAYTIDTLKEMQTKYPSKKIYFIIGADSLLEIYTWKQPEYLLKNAKFIVARRPDYSLKEIFLNERFRPYRQFISLLDNSMIDISSSQIRNLIKEEKSIKYLTLPVVIDYIKKNKLYRGK